MAALTVKAITRAGVAPTLVAADAGGDTFANDGKTLLHVKNSSGANAYTVGVVTTRDIKGIPLADLAVSVPTSGERFIGPFPLSEFGATVSVTYTGTAPATDLTVEPMQLDPDL